MSVNPSSFVGALGGMAILVVSMVVRLGPFVPRLVGRRLRGNERATPAVDRRSRKRTGRARRPAPSRYVWWRSCVLPAAAGLAAARAARGAGAGRRAAGRLGDGEVVRRLRVAHDRVAVDRRTGHLDLALGGPDVEAGGAELGRRVAELVVLRVGEARLDVRDQVASIRLGGAVLTLLLLTEEGRQGDRGEDADDQDDDEELDEREPTLLVLEPLQHRIL